MDVVVVGELNADLVLAGLTSLPAYGEVRLAKDMRFALGSSSAIFACNLARLGVEVGFVGKLGADETGNFLLRSLRDRGVETSQIIQSSDGRTGICVVMSFPHEYAMASYAGIRETFCLDDVNLDYVRSAKHMHMSSFYLQPALRPGCQELFRRAKEAGLSTSLDPDVDPSGKWNGGMRELLPYVDVFLPNEQEAARISGETDITAALNSLSRLSRTVVVKRGANGVLTKSGERTVEAPGFSVQPVDTTGAGDSFNAGFVFQFIQGAPLVNCVAWGNACGALSTRALGGTDGFPTRGEVEHFFSEHAEELENIRRAFA
jgi:sugar/nucleoside kinase (ribokinase family)